MHEYSTKFTISQQDTSNAKNTSNAMLICDQNYDFYLVIFHFVTHFSIYAF